MLTAINPSAELRVRVPRELHGGPRRHYARLPQVQARARPERRGGRLRPRGPRPLRRLQGYQGHQLLRRVLRGRRLQGTSLK